MGQNTSRMVVLRVKKKRFQRCPQGMRKVRLELSKLQVLLIEIYDTIANLTSQSHTQDPHGRIKAYRDPYPPCSTNRGTDD